MASPIVLTAVAPSVSGVRRKPRFTYQSPSATQLKRTTESEILIVHKPDTAVTIPPLPVVQPATTRVTRRTSLTLIPTRPKHMLEPPLPLYHPFGKLAMSLPDFDAEKYGLPIPVRLRDKEVNIDDDKPSSSTNGKRPARSRKPAAKLRDGEGDEEVQGKDDEGEGESEESKPVNVEIKEKEKVSPKKRRNGGNKRKRKDADDGDSAYPAKRVRNPRGVNHSVQNNSPEDEAGVETPDGTMAFDSEAVPERRTTRARANGNGSVMKRRDSTASSGSGSADKADENSKAPSEEQDEGKDGSNGNNNDENSAS